MSNTQFNIILATVWLAPIDTGSWTTNGIIGGILLLLALFEAFWEKAHK